MSEGQIHNQLYVQHHILRISPIHGCMGLSARTCVLSLSDLSLFNLSCHVITCFSAHFLFSEHIYSPFRPQKEAQLYIFTYMLSQFKPNAPKMFGPIWSLYLVVLVCSQTFPVTHECMHIHIKKNLSFSTEINVYSIPNVLCMRQYVWSRLYLAWGLRLRCFCGETDRQGERAMAMNRGTPMLI